MNDLKLFAFTCGWVIGPFRGEETGDVRVPVPCYLLDHPDGKALVDTGLHPAMRDAPHERIGWVADVLRFELGDGEDVGSRLRALGVDPAGLRFLVNSHLHFDHAGGNELIPSTVELVVQRREWEAGHDRAAVEANFFNPGDYEQEREVRAVEGEHDLYGDGSVLLLPTPGHTPGHQSLLLRIGEGEVGLCVDACYFSDWMDTEQSPPHGFDKGQELRSLRSLRALRDRGVQMIYGHDPEQWDELPRAPEPVRPRR